MKFFYSSIALCLSLIFQPAQADLVSDSEQIMNDAQQVYPQFFHQVKQRLSLLLTAIVFILPLEYI
ncbi:MAG: hypothetical protein L3J59_12835 [Methylococcaceae bacterium]|nr:hypothetical protein [Methylococcaceae bacterium]